MKQTKKQTVTIRRLIERADELGDTYLGTDRQPNGDIVVIIRHADGHLLRWKIWADGGAEII